MNSLRNIQMLVILAFGLAGSVPAQCVSAVPMSNSDVKITAPNGLQMGFTACGDGLLTTIAVEVVALSGSARLEIQGDQPTWAPCYTQAISLVIGPNLIQLTTPFPVDGGTRYKFAIFSEGGSLRLLRQQGAPGTGRLRKVDAAGAPTGGPIGNLKMVLRVDAVELDCDPTLVFRGQLLPPAPLRAIALGDFDGDCDQDVFLATGGANTVWFNQGDATFMLSGQMIGNRDTRDVAVGDIDGDGNLDVFETNYLESDRVLYGNGAGGFTAVTVDPTGYPSLDVALGDLDGDGDLDAVVGASTGLTKWYRNNGRPPGLWEELNVSATGLTATSIALGDMNGNGELEIVVAGQGIFFSDFLATTYSLGTAMVASGASSDIQLGDLDGDGDLDACVAGSSLPTEIWLNNGSASMSLAGVFGGSNTRRIALGDLDADGDLDIVEANNSGESNQIWVNLGNATFVKGDDFGSHNSVDVKIADLDGDHDLDLFVANTGGDRPRVYESRCLVVTSTTPANGAPSVPEGLFPRVNVSEPLAPMTVDSSSVRVHSPMRGELSGTLSVVAGGTRIRFDPNEDFLPGERIEMIAMAGVETGQGVRLTPYQFQFDVKTAAGCGDFGATAQTFPSAEGRNVVLGDLDGDGNLDAIFANTNSDPNFIFLGNGNGNFTATGRALGGWRTRSLALGDLDGDGDLDAFITNTSGQPDLVYFNDGASVFTDSGQRLANRSGSDVALGDVDGDGDLDAFVVSNGGGDVDAVWRNDGNGMFTDTGQALGSGSGRGVDLADLDGDGDLDAFIANGGGDPDQVLLNHKGVFEDSGQTLGSTRSLRVVLADVDGDGDVDAFVACSNGDGNRVYLNDGSSGSLVDSGQVLGSANTRGVALGDLDADGDLDAFVANGGDNSVWLNDGAGAFQDSGRSFGPANSFGVALGDLDGDGSLDAFVANHADSNAVWLSSGLNVVSTIPAHAEVDVARAASVTVVFDRAVNPSTINLQNFTVRGQQRGIYPGAILRATPETLVFTPGVDFLPGEHIEVTISSGLSGITLALGEPHTFHFEVETCADDPLLADSLQRLGGNGPSRGAALGDLDGDGDLDAFIAYDDNEGARVYLNTGGELLDSGQSLGSSQGKAVALGDLDGDGDLDAFEACDTGGHRIWGNNGGGTFSGPLLTSSGEGARGVVLADFDGDGNLDAYVATSAGNADELWFGDGMGGFASGPAPGIWDANNVACSDLDGNGEPDVLVTTASTDHYVLLNHCGRLTMHQTLVASTGFGTAPVLRDFDGDGDADLFLGSRAGRANEVWLNDGSGTFLDSGQALGGENTTAVAPGDFDGDGDLDVFVVNNGGNRVWVNDGNAAFTSSGQSLGSANDRNVAVGDLDQDGRLDVVTTAYGEPDSVWFGFVEPAMCGDCDGDYRVTILDALRAARTAAGLFECAPGQPCEYSCNVSGAAFPMPGAAITTLDALAIAQYITGLNQMGCPRASCP